MKSRLLRDLEAIEEGRPINWPATKRQLLRAGASLSLIDSALSFERFNEEVFSATILDLDAFAALKIYAEPVDKRSRLAASVTGDTHKTRVSGALLVATTDTSEVPYNHVFRPGMIYPQPNKQHALIIENLECFLEIKETYQFVLRHCGVSLPISDIEFLWGAGNSISNKLILPYLDRFQGSIMCLFDADLGGLRTYANLIAGGLSTNKAFYLVPDDLKERLHSSRRAAEGSYLDALSSVYGVSESTDQVISTLRYYKKTLEQESYREFNG